MKSVHDIRRENLRRLILDADGPTELSRKLGHTNGSYVAQLAGPNPSRKISETVAREIEAKLGMLEGEMDVEPRLALKENAFHECVKLVAAAVADAGAKPAPETYATLVTLALEHAKLVGKVDTGYIKRIVGLTVR